MGESSQPKVAQTMILMRNGFVSCINSSLESELFLSVSFTPFLDVVLTVSEIFLTRIHDGSSSFRRPWLDRSYGDASLGGPGFPLCPWGQSPKKTHGFYFILLVNADKKIATIGGLRLLCNSTGERCRWILSASDYKLVNTLLENTVKKKKGKNIQRQMCGMEYKHAKNILSCACIVLTRWETVMDLFIYWYRMPNSWNICQHLLEACAMAAILCLTCSSAGNSQK